MFGQMVYCTATTSRVAMPLGGSPIGQFVWVLDTRTGALRWQHDTGAGKLPNNFAAGVPTAVAGVVYVTSPGNRGVQALDAQTGRLRWHTTLPAMANAAPALDGVNLFLTDGVGTLYQIDARTGVVRHRMHLGGSIHNLGLVLASGTLFVPNAKGGLVYAIPESVMTMASTVDVAPAAGHGRGTVGRTQRQLIVTATPLTVMGETGELTGSCGSSPGVAAGPCTSGQRRVQAPRGGVCTGLHPSHDPLLSSNDGIRRDSGPQAGLHLGS